MGVNKGFPRQDPSASLRRRSFNTCVNPSLSLPGGVRMRPGSSRAQRSVWLTGSLQTRQVLNPIPSLTLQQNISMRGANSESFLCARHLSGCFSSEPHKTSTSAVASGVTLLSNVKNCRRPQNTVVSERSQSQEAIDCGISFI